MLLDKAKKIKSEKKHHDSPDVFSDNIKIIYEDENILVIDKPAGLVVQPEQSKISTTLIDYLLKIRPEIKDVGEDPVRPGLVHRLDKNTSGLMIIAKNNQVFAELKRKFQEHKIQKTYTALVIGQLKEKEGIIDKPIGRGKSRVKQSTTFIVTKERPAITKYKVIKEYSQFSLVEAYPKTGRMHQIRVHFASIGHPIAADNLYGFKRQPKIEGLNRQFLHASAIEFELFGKKYHFKADLPNDLQEALNQLKLNL